MDACPAPIRSLEIEACVTELRRMSAWLVAGARELGIARGITADLEVCAHEAADNIIRYGYEREPRDNKANTIRFTLATAGGFACLTVIDDAKPFNPLNEPERPNPASLQEAPIGGLGIRLIRGLCSDCCYKRSDGRNHLEMRIQLSQAPAQEVFPRGADRRDDGASQHPANLERRSLTVDRRQHGSVFRASFFHGIPWHAVEDAIRDCPVRQLAAGEVLLKSGQSNDDVYVLLSGRLSVQLPDAGASDAIFIEPGGSIGELSIIDRKPVSAHVVADIPSTVSVISSRLFWEALMPVPGFARNVMRQLSERMRSSNDIIVESMRERVAFEQLQKELGVAREIQSSMLPSRGAVPLDCGNADVYGLMDPARDIGGDFYDAFMTDSQHLLLMVGDVSGHGIPAALFMARAMTVLRAEAVRGRRRPSTLLERANTLLCAKNETGMFVTLLLALLNVETGDLQYSNAGHLPLCLRRADGTVSWLPLPSGTLVGMIENAKYATETLRLASGDTVLLYTDGVTEAISPHDELFGEERLLGVLKTSSSGAAHALVSHVSARIAEFVEGAPAADDITLLAMHWRNGVNSV